MGDGLEDDDDGDGDGDGDDDFDDDDGMVDSNALRLSGGVARVQVLDSGELLGSVARGRRRRRRRRRAGVPRSASACGGSGATMRRTCGPTSRATRLAEAASGGQTSAARAARAARASRATARALEEHGAARPRARRDARPVLALASTRRRARRVGEARDARRACAKSRPCSARERGELRAEQHAHQKLGVKTNLLRARSRAAAQARDEALAVVRRER